MISVIIPTLNAEETLPRCLTALIPATVEGVVRQVVIADGGSTDHTLQIAEGSGADMVTSDPGRGRQILAGIAKARSPWLLILHSDTVLENGWDNEAASFIEAVDLDTTPERAAAFRFSLDDRGAMPRILESLVRLRCGLAKLPYGDQALLLPRHFHDEIGGFRSLDIMEDIDIVRRIGRRRLRILRSNAITSPRRYVAEGYLRRIARNQMCLLMYTLGVSPQRIARFYGSVPTAAPQSAKTHTSASASRPASPS